MAKIHLATGPIQTGKTTRLLEWCTGRTDVDGLLAPIIDGHRHLVRISTGEARDLQQLGRADTPVTVGPYTFSSQVFAWARAQLQEAYLKVSSLGGSGWLVIDEYGKLELRGEGLEPAVSELVRTSNDSDLGNNAANVLLVIRDGLVEPALHKLRIAARDVEVFAQA